MKTVFVERVTFDVPGAGPISGEFTVPTDARACMVLAHGAGAGMDHSFMTAVSTGLAELRIASLRFNFPYMEPSSKRPDRPAVAHAAVQSAVREASRRCPNLLLIAGGKSFGGRMTSQAQADTPLPRVRGLVFFGFPLHPAGQPSNVRAAHLADVAVPMLFLKGTRDKLAAGTLLTPVIERLDGRATLVLIEQADHGFHVPVRSGRRDADVMAIMLDDVASWVAALIAKKSA